MYFTVFLPQFRIVSVDYNYLFSKDGRFGASPIYMVSSRTARTTQRDTVSKNRTNTEKKKWRSFPNFGNKY